MEFRELCEFTRVITEIATDRELYNLQLDLAANPTKGDLVSHTCGARKVRMRLPGKGKRGGARIIYYWQDSNDVIWMLKAYVKNEKQDLSQKEKKELCFMISDIKRGEI